MDWISCSSVFGVLKEAVLTVAAGVGIYVALTGLHTWKRQLFGSEKYQVARKVIRTTYRYRDAIEDARRLMVQGSESAQASQALQGSSVQIQEEQFLNTVYANRQRKVRQIGREFDAELLEAEVILGTDRESLRQPFDSLESELTVNIQLDMQRRAPGADPQFVDDIQRRLPNWRQVMPRSILDMPGPQHDPYSQDLLDAVSKIESIFRKHLGR